MCGVARLRPPCRAGSSLVLVRTDVAYRSWKVVGSDGRSLFTVLPAPCVDRSLFSSSLSSDEGYSTSVIAHPASLSLECLFSLLFHTQLHHRGWRQARCRSFRYVITGSEPTCLLFRARSLTFCFIISFILISIDVESFTKLHIMSTSDNWVSEARRSASIISNDYAETGASFDT